MTIRYLLLLMKHIALLAFCIVATAVATWSCKDSPTDSSIKYPIFPATVDTAAWGSIPTDSLTFYPGYVSGAIGDAAIAECSGLAASRSYPGLLWTENDHGNPNLIFLVDTTGIKKATFTITGVANRDWEDMAEGPGPIAGVNYVYLGEVGDNNDVYDSSFVYRFPEPTVTLTAGYTGAISGPSIEKINYKYPEGPSNTETVMIDPITKDIYLVTKGTISCVYVLPYPPRIDTMNLARRVLILPTSITTITAGDISADGNEIIIKNYTNVYHWRRLTGEPVWHAMLETPSNIPYIPEYKGEGMCFSPKGDRFICCGEYKDGPKSATMYQYVRR